MNFSLTPKEQAILISLARDSIESALDKKASDKAPVPISLTRPRGAFVTLTAGERLRGCIGRLTPSGPLAETIGAMARAAAFEDPRFPPIRVEEWPQISIEISVLGPMEPVASVEEILVGSHGLYIVQGFRSGVLLPQVAVEWGWDRDDFLAQVCRKAGLPVDAWREPSAQLYKFEAAVFGEKKPLEKDGV